MKYPEIIEKIKSIRLVKGFTLSKLSQKSGLSKGYLSKIENQTKLPPVSTLQRIARALDIDLSELFANGFSSSEDSKIAVVRKSERKKIGDVPYTGKSLGSKPAIIFMGQYRYKRDYGRPFERSSALFNNAHNTNGE